MSVGGRCIEIIIYYTWTILYEWNACAMNDEMRISERAVSSWSKSAQPDLKDFLPVQGFSMKKKN